jgi:hypothetical protein
MMSQIGFLFRTQKAYNYFFIEQFPANVQFNWVLEPASKSWVKVLEALELFHVELEKEMI